MRAISASALFCLLLLPACLWAQNLNQIDSSPVDKTQADRTRQIAAANPSGMKMDSDSSSSGASSPSSDGATSSASATSAGSSSSMMVSPMVEPASMVAPVAPIVKSAVPQPAETKKINPWTAPFSNRKFVAANSLLLFSWTADIEGTHFCLVRRTCIEGNHAIQGYPHPTRAQLYASTPWELPSVMASSYLSHVVLPRKWKWLSYLPPVLIGGMHAYYGEQGFKRGLFDARIRPSATSAIR